MQSTNRRPWRRAIGIAAGVLVLLAGFAASAEERGVVFSESGLAIRGYDPVAYFVAQKASPGKPELTHKWKGVTWRFTTEQNRRKFVANPRAYAPQYGGYCAYAASNNYIAPTDPHAWTVHEGKLYLNFSKHVRKRWSEDVPGNITRADENWPGLQMDL